MDKKNGKSKNNFIDIEKMSVPKGGGAFKGFGEELSISRFTGETSFNFPIYTSSCRGAQPKLNLTYTPSSQNGIFGMGFCVEIPHISRRTSKNIPTYDDSIDTFTLAGGGELVQINEYTDNSGYFVRVYMQRFESAEGFSLIEYYKKGESSFWRIRDRNNTVHTFGANNFAKIINPEKKQNVFAWLLNETYDDKGNKTKYIYNSNSNISLVQYGNYPDQLQEEWAFSIEFYYMDRSDSFKRFNSGFMRETSTLCDKILMVHNFAKKRECVMETSFHYCSSFGVSQLVKIIQAGIKTFENGEASRIELPAISLSYSPFNPTKQNFKSLETNIPALINNNGFKFIDLYGDGIAGLLYASENAILYCRALGEYKYAPPEILHEFPLHKDLSNDSYAIASIEGNGRYQLLARSSSLSGFYELKDGKWDNFVPFAQEAKERLSPFSETADLQGDRLNHLFVPGSGFLRYYPSLKKEGDGAAVTKETPENFPNIAKNDPVELVRFLDIFGDGLVHRVRVKNGCVEIFPNLGYGEFGEMIIMENSPYFEEGLDISRLFFADLDGSGTTDFIYIYPDRADIYLNIAGKLFADPFSIKLPEIYSKNNIILFEDICGAGASVMLFGKNDFSSINYCYDFTGGKKPYLLTEINNGNGVLTQLEYESSVSLYCKDKANNDNWRLKPPFPVQVVVKKTVTDEISKNTQITEFSYKDGLFDYQENEFKGFGEVSEFLREHNYNGEPIAVPILRKSWHYIENSDCALESEKALWGKIIKEEIYSGLDAPVEEISYSYRVNELFRPENNRRGIYFSYISETINCRNENDCTDPIIKHDFNLETDDYGNISKKCAISYPRRKAPNIPESIIEAQKTMHIMLFENHYINKTGESRHLGVPYENMTFEINGINEHEIFTFEKIKAEINLATEDIIPFGQNFDLEAKQARLIEFKRHLYWNDALTEALPLGEIESCALTYRIEEAVFPQNFHAFKDKFNESLLELDCGYKLEDGYWWNEGLTRFYYDKLRFCLPHYEENSKMNVKTEALYDKYCLFPIEIKRYAGDGQINKTEAVVDYCALNYSQITDINGNINQALFDALGRVIAVTSFGTTNGQSEGDADISKYYRYDGSFNDIINKPEKYIQDISAYYFYDICAFYDHGIPAYTIALEKDNFKTSNEKPLIKTTISYWDGFNRKIEERHKEDNGKWAVLDKIEQNIRGEKILIYNPFFIPKALYDDKTAGFPTMKYYDWKGRNILTKRPEDGIDGIDFAYLLSKTEYGAWDERYYDENSILEESEYYNEFMKRYPKDPTIRQMDQYDALKKALSFKNNARIKIFDGLGNKIADVIDYNTADFVLYGYDSRGNILAISDARLLKNESHNIEYIRAMNTKEVYTKSCDSGDAFYVHDIFGNLVHTVNANGVHKKTTYDALSRPVCIWVDGIGMVEKIIYGEHQSDSEDKNLRGQIYKRYDQAGLETFHYYSIKGNIKEKTRQLCASVENINWDIDENVAFEEKEFQESFTYNALGKVTSHKTPDNAIYLYSYDCFGRLSSSGFDDDKERIVKKISYNPEGHRSEIIYGNGVISSYCHNDISLRLENVKSIRPENGGFSTIQDLSHTYDPAGNTSRIRDNTGQTVYGHNQAVEPFTEYFYDKYYRLSKAIGRELINENDYEGAVCYKQEYCYDYSGNMTKLMHSAPGNNYTVNMLIDEVSNRLISINDKKIEYDYCGNMKAHPELPKMQWNYDGRLEKAVTVTRLAEEDDFEFYIYDHDQNRIKKINRRKKSNEIFEETEKVYLGDFIIKRNKKGEIYTCMQINDGQFPIGEIFRTVDETKVIFKLETYTNSIAAELNEKAEIISIEEFYPFGGTAIFKQEKESFEKAYRFCNKELDASGLYYYGARYYSALYSRMVSADSTEFIKPDNWQSLNLYSYCNNNPIKYVDPTGQCPTGAHAPFDTRFGAAIDFAKSYSAISVEENKEYGALLYSFHTPEGKTQYSYTTPDRGGESSLRITIYDPTVGEDAAIFWGSIHTHAAAVTRGTELNLKNLTSGESFSPSDLKFNLNVLGLRGQPGNTHFLVTPLGDLLRHHLERKADGSYSHRVDVLQRVVDEDFSFDLDSLGDRDALDLKCLIREKRLELIREFVASRAGERHIFRYNGDII